MSIAILQSDASRAVEKLNDLSNEELDEILNSEEKLDEIVSGLEGSYLKEVANEKENLIAENDSMAEFNLTKEPLLVEGREKLKSLYEEIETLTKTVDDKLKELRDKGGDISIETALALLQTAASETEEESEKTAKKFLDNEVDIEMFLDDFHVKRRLMHMRLVKADKLSKILQRGPINNGPNYINAPPVNINSGYFPGVPSLPVSPPGGNVPYPIGPLNMPMPPTMNYYQNNY